MAAAPPPYSSGPAGGPGNYDPRQQWKYQRRMQKEQWRTQRAYYRGLRRPSLVRPLVLIAIGVIALLIQAGTISGYAFWDWYVRWWPLLLIGLGVLLLGEWLLERGQPYGMRTGVGGIVFLIILVAVLGMVGKHAINSPFGWHFSDDDNDWRNHLFGQEHDADRQFDQAFGANGRLTIDNPHGDVSISTSSDDQIHVSAHQSVWTSNDRNADRMIERLHPTLEVNGSQATLKTSNVDRGSVDLTVQVPAETSITMKTGRGNVAVNGLNGTVGVDAGHGNVTLNKIGGACTTHMGGGDFAAHALGSTLALSGRTEDASISDVTGTVSLNGDFLGDVNLSKLAAPFTFHSNRTSMQIEKLTGDLSLNHDDLNLEDAKGQVQARTGSTTVKLTGVAGPLEVDTSDGDINVDLDGGNGAITLRSKNGGIHLGLPDGHLYHVDASSHDGDVSSELTYSGSVQRSEHSLRGDTGSGSGATPVTLMSDHGDIEIKRSEPKSEAPEAPEQPEQPEQPEKPSSKVPRPPKPPRAPHLRVPENAPAPEATQQ